MRMKRPTRFLSMTEFLMYKAKQAFNQGIEARLKLMDYFSKR